MNKINLKLVTPERTVLDEELDSLSCPTNLGQITILPHHVPLVATLMPGELIAKSGGNEHFINVAGGFVEVREGGQVVILADAAEHHYEIDAQKAQAAVEQAKRDMSEQRLSGEEYAKVAATLERNLARLNISKKHSHRKTAVADRGVFEE